MAKLKQYCYFHAECLEEIRYLVAENETAEFSCYSSPQYLTAVVPGPDGTSQYVTLPADPRVLNGQYSYAMLQQPDGSTQIVLVENNSVGRY